MGISLFQRVVPLAAAATLIALAASGSAAAQDPATPAATAPIKPMSLMSAVFPSSDLERSTAFYTRGLGLTAARGANPREVVLNFPGGTASLMLLKPAAEAAAARSAPARAIVEVPDIRAIEIRLQSAGFGLRGPITRNEKYGISIAWVEDPDGNALELIQRGP